MPSVRSGGACVVTFDGDPRKLVWTLDVYGLGTLTIHATSDPRTGRISYDSVAVTPTDSESSPQ